ncbi:signal peptide, CUB and EGF-like domain-containing protein 2 [Branchiostoma floridae]|uniref:Signal peptide, CUB and EGF-like domain-containing protein 2 n=1 Tax=Branchiostoma floridae TaxID=7739 RepID=A0A9J7KWS8_BRAFL|nr:signal peptide, CUB and EGF-like domain-containing protein 2 [Branchiostoma floridae]
MHGSYRCICQAGYQLDADDVSCIDADECLANGGRGPCDQICTDLDGSYRCSCEDGYQLNSDGFSCADVVECDANGGQGYCDPFHGVCQNTPGSYHCYCEPGYELQDDLRSCTATDVDGCFADACDNGGTCVDGDSTLSCTCPTGYKGERCQTPPCSEDYDAPQYGGKVCTTSDLTTGAMMCTVFCEGDREFAWRPADAYTCNAEGTWSALSAVSNGPQPLPPGPRPWPDCTGRYRPGRAHIKGEVFYYYDGDCQSSIQEIITNFEQIFSDLQSAQPGAGISTQLGTVDIECGSTARSLPRSKRSVVNLQVIKSTGGFTIKFEVVATISDETVTENQQLDLVFALDDVYFEIEEKVASNQFNLPIGGQLLSAASFEMGFAEIQVNCTDGQLAYQDEFQAYCTDCPPGTFHAVGTDTCEDCPVGQYQDRSAQVTCKTCPHNTWTVFPRSVELAECVAL